MLSIIKDSYFSFFKQIHKWIVVVLPLAIFSYLDEYLRGEYGYCWGMKLAGIVLLTLTELFIFKKVAALELGNIWNVVKKVVLISVYQVVIGLIMLVPVYIAIKIAQHHQILSLGYIFWAFVINIFLGGWLFAKTNAILPSVVAGEKLNISTFKSYTKGSYMDWVWVSLLIYFPYIISLYMVDCVVLSIAISSLFVAVFSLFNIKYYQSKK